ncbi:arrestin domain-containing protein 17-like isoform X2 [Halictus rubicundus]|uniref:arrestin domain-containing protein 17-like isoform X2 n=1 Tax=Halictus rubicundus TaxID=77578 RepID=UPI0040363EE3
MSSLGTFRIEFDKPDATYVPGEMVTGSIILDIAKVKKVRGFYFVAKGAALVRWTETRRRKGETERLTYSASQKYFSVRTDILEPSELDSRINIPEGHHQFPFQFQVPSNIPSSFEHEHGHIRYTVKAVIDRPWKFDHECKAAFTVVSILDLNAHRDKCLGIYDEDEETFCFCLCNKGAMNIVTQTPSSGYVPGQAINIMVNYKNDSEIQITKITTKLKRVLKLHATSKTKTEHSEISSNSYAGPFTSQGVANLEIRVPPIPPSHLPFCDIIDLNYNLKVIVHVTGLYCKIERSYPLLIGSIPLYCAPSTPPIEKINITTHPTMPMPEIPGTSNLPPPPPGFVIPDQAGASLDWNIPPPSYEECMSGAQNIKDDDESDHVQGASMPFSPKYPVFHYPSIDMQEKR